LSTPEEGRNATPWRIVAVVLIALPIAAASFVYAGYFLLVPFCFALLGWLSRWIAWPPLIRLASVCIATWPVAASMIFTDAPSNAFWGFLGIGAVCLLIFLAGVSWHSREFRASLTEHVAAVLQTLTHLRPESLATLRARGIPLLATTTVRETDAGIEYTVAWTDFAKLRLVDRYELLTTLPVAAAIALALGAGLGSAHKSTAEFLTVLGFFCAAVSIVLWLYLAYHQRARYAARSIVFGADGSIAICNPPSDDPNRESDGPSVVIENGLRRLVSIEYGRTSEWYRLRKECVFDASEWHDVFMLFDVDRRVPVSRAVGAREHAHQVSGQLNEVRARLMAIRSQRPGADTLID
jgi:hypothetical protein